MFMAWTGLVMKYMNPWRFSIFIFSLVPSVKGSVSQSLLLPGHTLALFPILPGSSTWLINCILIYTVHAHCWPASPVWTSGNLQTCGPPRRLFSSQSSSGEGDTRGDLRIGGKRGSSCFFSLNDWGTDLPFPWVWTILCLLLNPSLALGGLGVARPHESRARLSGKRPGSPNLGFIAFPRSVTEMCVSCLRAFQQAA